MATWADKLEPLDLHFGLSGYHCLFLFRCYHKPGQYDMSIYEELETDENWAIGHMSTRREQKCPPVS